MLAVPRWSGTRSGATSGRTPSARGRSSRQTQLGDLEAIGRSRARRGRRRISPPKWYWSLPECRGTRHLVATVVGWVSGAGASLSRSLRTAGQVVQVVVSNCVGAGSNGRHHTVRLSADVLPNTCPLLARRYLRVEGVSGVDHPPHLGNGEPSNRESRISSNTHADDVPVRVLRRDADDAIAADGPSLRPPMCRPPLADRGPHSIDSRQSEISIARRRRTITRARAPVARQPACPAVPCPLGAEPGPPGPARE